MAKPMHLALGLAAVMVAAMGLSVLAGRAQQPQTVSPYRPGLGDMMTMTVQPRHIKLGLAGRAQNWAFADYELHELEEAFDRAGRVWPTWRGKPIPDMVKSVAGEPIAALRQAIKAADADKFARAYSQLTDACNVCHQSSERAMIVIQVPESSPYPDQDFRPPKR